MLAVLDQSRCSFTSSEMHVKSAYRSSFSSTEDLDANLGAFAPLPNEVITLVFRHMSSARDVCALSAAARLFYCLGNDQTLWRDMCLKHYGDQVVATTNKHFLAFGKDWIWLYKSKVELKASTGVGLKKVQNRGTLQGEWVEDQLQGYGVQVVTKEDDEDESAWGLYEGTWAEGKRSGKGYWYGADGSYFEGVWREGKEERGLSKWTDGDSYDGEWRDGEKNGRGKYMWVDGSWYDGEWKDGEEDGAGKFMWSDGDWYEGEWANGKKNGRGRYTWTDGSWYEGDWQNSQRHGWGVRVWGKGSKWEGDKYEGEWSDGDMHGRGRYTYADGSYYEGEWSEGKMHGRGKYTWADGGWYEGEFRNDNFHGTGVRVWGVGHEREGDRFVGTWTEDRMEVGIYFRRNGDRYEGPFKDGKENGLGVLFFGGGGGGHRNESHQQGGDVYRGMFKDGLMHGEGFYAQAGTGETFQGEWIGGVVVRRLCTIIASAGSERKRKRRETN